MEEAEPPEELAPFLFWTTKRLNIEKLKTKILALVTLYQTVFEKSKVVNF